MCNDRAHIVIDHADSIQAHGAGWVSRPTVGGASWTSLSKIPFESVHLAG